MPEFTRLDNTVFTLTGPVPCDVCGAEIAQEGLACICPDAKYYCSTYCLAPHKSICIPWVIRVKPRPSNMYKLAFYFPPNHRTIKLCWVPCPTLTKVPCVPPCEDCIVCEGCHECRANDYPLPDAILAAGAYTTAVGVQGLISNYYLEPGVTYREDWTVATLFGLCEDESLIAGLKNRSIEKLIKLSLDWDGPYVLIGNEWSDCEGNMKTRDVTAEDLETAKKFFISTTPKEMDIDGYAEDEIIENSIMEMHEILDSALKRQ
ncbi:hypothetical protein EYC80_007442 [Monilinia laxa]|uniref:Uncharacterized protein n=1 Tax=Monilinia laxa TaxID=61186 RepID=A0A5N6JVY7_MONLA|nr:hypothetical protein EYC80_007442 [Monilinia laxa]